MKYLKAAEKIETPLLDFSDVEIMTISAGVYLRAFCDHLRIDHKGYNVTCKPENRKVREILKFLNVRENYELDITHKDISCWTMRDWDMNKAAPNFGRLLMDDILPRILEDKIPSENFSEIASALHEVLFNCVEHAYDGLAQKFKGYYFIAGEYLDNSNTFSFCIVDRGKGFLESLKQQNLTLAQKYISSEGEMIKAAVYGQSGAGKKGTGRGTGLQSVLSRVKGMEGEFFIYSGRGFYHYSNGKEDIRNQEMEIKGALFSMILPISGNKEE